MYIDQTYSNFGILQRLYRVLYHQTKHQFTDVKVWYVHSYPDGLGKYREQHARPFAWNLMVYFFPICSHYQYVSMKSLHFISGISRPWTGLHPLSHSMQVPSHGRDLLLWKEGQGLPVEKSLVEKCLSTNTNSTSVIYGKKWLWLWFENGLCHQKLMGLTIKNDGFSLVIKTKIRTYRPKSA